MLAAARLDRITRQAHTLSQLLEDGYSIRAADMPGVDDLMMRIYAAMAQKERELISERTKAALAAARARGKALGEGRGYRPTCGPDASAAAVARRQAADRAAYHLVIEVEALRQTGVTSMQGLARALNEGGVSTPAAGKPGRTRRWRGCWLGLAEKPHCSLEGALPSQSSAGKQHYFPE